MIMLLIRQIARQAHLVLDGNDEVIDLQPGLLSDAHRGYVGDTGWMSAT
jgi:hypothetical protein